MTVIVNALPPNVYPIHPGVGAIYKQPLYALPNDGVIATQAGSDDLNLRLRSEAILVREPQPENVILAEVQREPIMEIKKEPDVVSQSQEEPITIQEEVVSKTNGPSLVVGKIAQPLSINPTLGGASADRPSNAQRPVIGKGQTVVVNGPSTYGGRYAPTTVPRSQTGFDHRNSPDKVNEERPTVREPGPLNDGHIYPPVMFDDPNIASLIPDGPVIVDEQIARDHLYIQDGPLYHPGTGALYRPRPGTVIREGPAPGPSPDTVYMEGPPPGPRPNTVYMEGPAPGPRPNTVYMEGPAPIAPVAPVRRLDPPVYEYAKFSPTVVIRTGIHPVLATIPVTTVLDAAPIYVAPKLLPSLAVTKDTVSTIQESRLDVLQPSPYLTPPAIKEPIIVNKW